MKKAFAVFLVLALMTGLGYLIYSYTPDIAHENFDARMNIQNLDNKEESSLFITEIKEELQSEEASELDQ